MLRRDRCRVSLFPMAKWRDEFGRASCWLKGDISQREIAEAGQGTAGIQNYPKQGSTYYPGGLYYQRNTVEWKFSYNKFLMSETSAWND